MSVLTPKMSDLLTKGAVAVFYVVGTILTAYNLSAFKNDKYGIYFLDANQLWLSIGLGLFAAGWAVRNWKKLVS